MSNIINLAKYKEDKFHKSMERIKKEFKPTIPAHILEDCIQDRNKDPRPFTFKEAEAAAYGRIVGLWESMSRISAYEREIILKAWKMGEISILLPIHEP